MTGTVYRLFTGILISMSLNAQAYTKVEPPVASQKPVSSPNTFSFNNTTSVESDVLWRGMSLTRQQPGWRSLNEAAWERSNLQSLLSVNLYSNASNTTPTQGPTTLTGPAGTTTEINHLMIEAKLGTSYTFAQSGVDGLTIGIAKANYSWPGGRTWLWVGPECQDADSKNNNLLTAQSSIKSIRSTELTMSWNEFTLLYSRADDSSKPIINGTAVGADNQAYRAPYGKNWGNYLHISSPKREINQFYRYNFEYGNWQDMGQFIQANIHYAFNKSTNAVLKVYDFKGSGGNDSNTGAVGALTVNYQSPTMRR